jgi:hypothetical protein
MAKSGTGSSISAANQGAAERRRPAARAAASKADEAAPHGAAVNGAKPAPALIHETKPPGEADLRLRIFIIDTGWNSAASRVLKENTEVLCSLTEADPIYVLDRETSVQMLRQHRQLIGRDPIISVHNMHALEKSGTDQEHGFRIHLGLLTSEEQVLVALRMFANFIARYRTSKNIEVQVRRRLRREGVAGAIEIIGGGHANELLRA